MSPTYKVGINSYYEEHDPAMNILADLKMYGRFAWRLRGFLRHTVSLEEARAIVRRRMEEREANFMRLGERGIFGYPRAPWPG